MVSTFYHFYTKSAGANSKISTNRNLDTNLILIQFNFLSYPLTKDIQPNNEDAHLETREFLQKVTDILLDYVNACNDRNEKILEFHHPEDMIKLLDLDINQQPVPLQQLVHDCATTLKYQVKTGEKKT